ncbi:ATPase_AAA_core domain-containing protein [Vibrio chagasii]|nr:ATPase_AAA_core domain-containing protein [Vibrio chagasii]CAH7170599.1 ATPase_AAA_core domain-containing protein [Vibrio chagasii]CAH7317347.1 ATPase_AAA_core domain-containing protein [Vibrio chagasii]CAH7432237.1 ATPase_AAA_core domain-containing protein [Vibrio chagasii]CAH7437557.1 ATPase_AAA_core domain-containing protein [Vibrio chagasii]
MSVTIVDKAQKSSYHIKNLFLDPNNYRFIDLKKHESVDDSSLTDAAVQRRTRHFIEGKNCKEIKDLLVSFRANGFLDIDVIQVKDLGNNKYLVLEGNRRVAALKALYEDHENGLSIGQLKPSIFKSVPLQVHAEEENEKHLVLMGLKHISGNKKWSTYNQAKLIYDYLLPYRSEGKEVYAKKETYLCDSLAITKVKLRTMQRVLHLIIEYQSSEYEDQFESSAYGLFEEIIKKPSIKAWLDWDDDLYTSRNRTNLDRLFSWISRTPEMVINEDGEEEYEEFEPIITKSLEIRDLSLFIDNQAALVVMENERSLAQGLMVSGTAEKQNYNLAMNKFRDSLSTLVSYQSLVSPDDLPLLLKAKEQLDSILPKSSSLTIERGNFSYSFEFGVTKHFSEISVKHYKGLLNFDVGNLSRINIFAGFNNSGKTSLIEAIYLLSMHNDIGAFLNLIKLKNKLPKLSPVWLNEAFDEKIEVSGVFNNETTTIQLNKFEADDIDKKDDYVASYKLEAEIAQRSLINTIHTFAHQPLIRENERVERLCPSAFKSPYFYDLDDILSDHAKSVVLKDQDGKTAISLIVDFLKTFDSTIEDVRLVEDSEVKRFIVESTRYSYKDLDMTSYGEGLQRIFYIALGFASSKNGIICIDEFETAIHYSLLLKFTKFIQILADMFNVQVFLTSHSKECIDAFLLNDYSNDSISGYLLDRTNDEIKLKNVRGDRFKKLIETINLDIRGSNHG